jgi:pyruvate ferredoxin oxidoreductase gamma subunit
MAAGGEPGEKNVLQIIIHGRGGQGAQFAGNMLAEMYFQEGRHVLAYATYGGARRGTLVSSSLRVAEKRIRMRCDIDNPDAIVCFDPSLLAMTHLLNVATEKTLILINSSLPSEEFSHLGKFKVVTIDARAIAREQQLGRIVNTTLVGALLGQLGYTNIDLLKKVVAETSPVKQEENLAACMKAYGMACGRIC